MINIDEKPSNSCIVSAKFYIKKVYPSYKMYKRNCPTSPCRPCQWAPCQACPCPPLCKYPCCCPGPPGATGATGPQGPIGPAGGLSSYAYIYNLAAQVVAIEADINFSDNGVIVGPITHAPGTASINLGSDGDYAVWFNVAGVEPGQFALLQNGAPVAGSVYGSGAGTQPNPGMVIITASSGDVLTLRNHSSSAAVTLQTLAGGTQVNANASIIIQKLSN